MELVCADQPGGHTIARTETDGMPGAGRGLHPWLDLQHLGVKKRNYEWGRWPDVPPSPFLLPAL